MKRGKMDISLRAKQFMPFAALKGYEQALREKEKIKVNPHEYFADTKEELDYKLSKLHTGDMVTVIYYEEDQYYKVTGMLTKIDYDFHTIKVVDKQLHASLIRDIEIEE